MEVPVDTRNLPSTSSRFIHHVIDSSLVSAYAGLLPCTGVADGVAEGEVFRVGGEAEYVERHNLINNASRPLAPAPPQTPFLQLVPRGHFYPGILTSSSSTASADFTVSVLEAHSNTTTNSPSIFLGITPASHLNASGLIFPLYDQATTNANAKRSNVAACSPPVKLFNDDYSCLLVLEDFTLVTITWRKAHNSIFLATFPTHDVNFKSCVQRWTSEHKIHQQSRCCAPVAPTTSPGSVFYSPYGGRHGSGLTVDNHDVTDANTITSSIIFVPSSTPSRSPVSAVLTLIRPRFVFYSLSTSKGRIIRQNLTDWGSNQNSSAVDSKQRRKSGWGLIGDMVGGILGNDNDADDGDDNEADDGDSGQHQIIALSNITPHTSPSSSGFMFSTLSHNGRLGLWEMTRGNTGDKDNTDICRPRPTNTSLSPLPLFGCFCRGSNNNNNNYIDRQAKHWIKMGAACLSMQKNIIFVGLNPSSSLHNTLSSCVSEGCKTCGGFLTTSSPAPTMIVCDTEKNDYRVLSSSYNSLNANGGKGSLRAVAISPDRKTLTTVTVGETAVGKEASRDIVLDGCFNGSSVNGGVAIEYFDLVGNNSNGGNSSNKVIQSSLNATNNVLSASYENLAWLQENSFLGLRGVEDLSFAEAMDEFMNCENPVSQSDCVKTLRNCEQFCYPVIDERFLSHLLSPSLPSPGGSSFEKMEITPAEATTALNHILPRHLQHTSNSLSAEQILRDGVGRWGREEDAELLTKHGRNVNYSTQKQLPLTTAATSALVETSSADDNMDDSDSDLILVERPDAANASVYDMFDGEDEVEKGSPATSPPPATTASAGEDPSSAPRPSLGEALIKAHIRRWRALGCCLRELSRGGALYSDISNSDGVKSSSTNGNSPTGIIGLFYDSNNTSTRFPTIIRSSDPKSGFPALSTLAATPETFSTERTALEIFGKCGGPGDGSDYDSDVLTMIKNFHDVVECATLNYLDKGKRVGELDEFEESIVKLGESAANIGGRGIALFGIPGENSFDADMVAGGAGSHSEVSKEASRHMSLVESINVVRRSLAVALYNSGNNGGSQSTTIQQAILYECFRRSTFAQCSNFSLPDIPAAVLTPSQISPDDSASISFMQDVLPTLDGERLLKLLAPYRLLFNNNNGLLRTVANLSLSKAASLSNDPLNKQASENYSIFGVSLLRGLGGGVIGGDFGGEIVSEAISLFHSSRINVDPTWFNSELPKMLSEHVFDGTIAFEEIRGLMSGGDSPPCIVGFVKKLFSASSSAKTSISTLKEFLRANKTSISGLYHHLQNVVSPQLSLVSSLERYLPIVSREGGLSSDDNLREKLTLPAALGAIDLFGTLPELLRNELLDVSTQLLPALHSLATRTSLPLKEFTTAIDTSVNNPDWEGRGKTDFIRVVCYLATHGGLRHLVEFVGRGGGVRRLGDDTTVDLYEEAISALQKAGSDSRIGSRNGHIDDDQRDNQRLYLRATMALRLSFGGGDGDLVRGGLEALENCGRGLGAEEEKLLKLLAENCLKIVGEKEGGEGAEERGFVLGGGIWGDKIISGENCKTLSEIQRDNLVDDVVGGNGDAEGGFRMLCEQGGFELAVDYAWGVRDNAEEGSFLRMMEVMCVDYLVPLAYGGVVVVGDNRAWKRKRGRAQVLLKEVVEKYGDNVNGLRIAAARAVIDEGEGRCTLPLWLEGLILGGGKWSQLVMMYLEKGLYEGALKGVIEVLRRLKREGTDELLPEEGSVVHLNTEVVDLVWEVCVEENVCGELVKEMERELDKFYEWVKLREEGVGSLRALKR